VVLGSLSKTYAMNRLAGRLRAGVEVCHGQPQQAPVAIDLERHQLCAEGRRGRPGRLAGVRQRVPRRIHRPARLYAGQAGRNPRRHLHQARGRVLCLPNIGAFLGQGRNQDGDGAGHAACSTKPHVVTVPGEAFGTAQHIRISYPVTRQNIDEGTRRMGEFLARLGSRGDPAAGFSPWMPAGYLVQIPPFSARWDSFFQKVSFITVQTL